MGTKNLLDPSASCSPCQAFARPLASPSPVGIFVHQLYNVVPSLCMTLDPLSANVGLTDLRASLVPMHDLSRL